MSSSLWEGVREGCGSCEFAKIGTSHSYNPNGDPVPYSWAECRRYPPTMIPIRYNIGTNQETDSVEAHHPHREVHDWCGEWKRKS